jgi:hypothetical protein
MTPIISMSAMNGERIHENFEEGRGNHIDIIRPKSEVYLPQIQGGTSVASPQRTMRMTPVEKVRKAEENIKGFRNFP